MKNLRFQACFCGFSWRIGVGRLQFRNADHEGGAVSGECGRSELRPHVLDQRTIGMSPGPPNAIDAPNAYPADDFSQYQTPVLARKTVRSDRPSPSKSASIG